jgi:hypothetical protein
MTKITLLCLLTSCFITTYAVAQTQLPQPDPKFEGKIGETIEDSVPSYPQPVKARAGSPNVLLISAGRCWVWHVFDVRRGQLKRQI